jgi:hypothetical protein
LLKRVPGVHVPRIQKDSPGDHGGSLLGSEFFDRKTPKACNPKKPDTYYLSVNRLFVFDQG